MPTAAARHAGAVERRVRTRCATTWATTAAEIDCTLRRRRRRQRAARRPSTASSARPRTPCAAAAPMSCCPTSASSATRAPIPMILATGAVHTPSGAPAAAHLHLAQCALRRMPRRALLRRADRRRRHHGQSLSRARRRSPTAIGAACSRRHHASRRRSRATRRRSTTACSRSCRRWASPSSRPIAAAIISRRSACRARWSPSFSPA